MHDVDRFVATPELSIPEGNVYPVTGLERGDHLQNWSPDEAALDFQSKGRLPLTLTEGILWAIQLPTIVEPGSCFMTTGSRLRRANGTFDARTPAVWISGGTGRDGLSQKGAPKVGWCWWRNRHTWLGIASCAGRSA